MSESTLLLVDDRLQTLQQRKKNLEPFGYSVMVATNVLSALSILEKTPVSAVLVEYKSEGMDAEAVAYHVKQHFPSQPLVLLSAYSAMPERVLWLVDEYVLRSEPVAALIKAIEKVTRPDDFGKANKPTGASNGKRSPRQAIA